MSINWVMLAHNPVDGYVPLPQEATVYRAPERTSFKIQPAASPSQSSIYPGSPARPLKLEASVGRLILTSQRLIYLPDSGSFESFAAPLKNIHDAHITQPWFGPNAWTCVVAPVPGGGLLEGTPYEVAVTFKDGGVFEFHDSFERIRERMQDGVNHIDELPTYTHNPGPAVHHVSNPPVAAGSVDELPPPYEAE